MIASTLQERFAGVVKIVRFNVQFYVASVAGLLAAGYLVAMHLLPRWLEAAVLCGAAAMMFWLLSSVLVSWYVYDVAGVTRWEWLPAAAAHVPRRWVNIHAGLDESTQSLRRMFPGTEGVVIDVYNATEMTEPSIARARLMYPASEPFVSARFDALPLADADRDTAFLLMAAHELRSPSQRRQLLSEVARVLQNDGQAMLVEHLRDWKNFAAFGPGFLHFHSAREWRASVRDAGLRMASESEVTPFVRCFVLRKKDA